MHYYIALLSLLLLPLTAQADGLDAGSVPAEETRPKLDKRLLPVLPGQEVRIGEQKMRVWSSSGPVPVSEVPQAPQLGSRGVAIDSVVVDARAKQPNTAPNRPDAPSEE